jgi:hypothetical protein
MRFLSIVCALLAPVGAIRSQRARPTPPRDAREVERASAAGEMKEDVEGRDEWFWAQRTYPFSERPYDKMANLYSALRARPSLFASSAATSAPLTGNWRAIGPNGLWVFLLETGRIAAIVPALRPGGPMYVGTASGGVWRSKDNGLTWTPMTDHECMLTTGAMALDPVDPNIVYAATGEGNGGLNGCGVLRSADGGGSWTTGATGLKSTNGSSGAFLSLAVDPATAASPSSVLIGATRFSNAGIVRSVNAGASWTVVLNTGPGSSIVAHPTKAGTYYAGNRAATSAAARGVYRSTDVGQTWTQLPPFPGIDANSIDRVEVAVSKAAPGSVWALVGDRNSGSFLGLFKYDETANEWTQLPSTGITTGLFGGQESYDLVLAVDPVDPRRIYVAGVRAFRSVDGGATFQPMATDVHVDWHVLVFDPNDPTVLWAGTDGGVYVSTDGGNSWSSRSAGLSITQFYPGVSVHPLGTRISGGSQDNGTHIFTGTPFWDAFLGGDGGYTAINYANPNIQWAETQWSVGGVPNIFRQDALSSARRAAGISSNDRAQFIPPLVMDPVNPAKLYFGTYRLYQTVNEGLSWTALGGDLSAGTGTITSISVSPADTMTIYVGTSDGRALVSRDGGVTFTAATGLPARSVTRVTAHPTDPLRALITVSGFGSSHVFETTNAFASIVHDINGNLTDAPANVAIYMPSLGPGTIVAGTDVGVFQSVDNGVTWTVGPTGLPNVIVYDLVYQPAIGLLIAGTYGRGMFAYDVGAQTATLRGDVNGDGKIDAADALLIQQALVGSLSSSTAIYPRGDANCNGSIDAADVVLVLRAAVGLSTTGTCVGTTR